MPTRTDATSPEYCPCDVVPLAQVLAGEETFVDSPYGMVRCFRSGGGTGGGTVFMHGVHDDMDTWSPLIRATVDRGIDLGPALFVDLPGFGRSENRRGRLDLSDLGDAVLEVGRRLLGDSPHRLVGHSMGTLVAADLAVRHPARVRSLHLASGPYYSIVDTMNGRLSGGVPAAFAGAIFGSQYLLALAGRPGVAGLQVAARLGVLRPFLAPFVAHPLELRQSAIDHVLHGMRPAAFRSAARNGFRYRDGMSWSKITCPVHAAFGSADRLVPRRDAARLGRDVPQAVVRVLDDAAHLIHIEQPGATLDALGLDLA